MTRPRHPDRRHGQRVELLLKVVYEHPTDLLHDYITNLGAGGVFIHTTMPLQVGQRLRFSLSFPGLLEPLELAGVVRWRNEEPQRDDRLPPGLGVEFCWDSDAQRQQLQQLLERISGDAVAKNSAAPRGGFSVLLVEDNTFVRELFEHSIRRFHADAIGGAELRLHAASSADEALARLPGLPLDLAVVDHFLPGTTGCELVRQLRALPRHRALPILVVSVGGEAIRRQAHQAGADMYLDKPVMTRQLVRTLALLLAPRG